MENETAMRSFHEGLRGEILEPNDPDYEEARKVYNAMIDKKPKMIVKCTDVADVKLAVNFARENKLTLSIRGGGHNAGGLGICDNGLVIDLSLMRFTRVDPHMHTITVGGGTTWGEVDHASQAFGMVTPSGIISTTGVGGLTTGGGLGHLSRKFGLSIDNLLAVDMVLADGSFVTANESENRDLFWAVRGGGGNFGVITAFTFQLHKLDQVYAGPMLYELSDAEEVLKWYRKFIKYAPDDLNGFFAFMTVPPGPPFPEHLHMKKVCGIVWNFTGPKEEAEEAFRAIREYKEPILDLVGFMPYPTLQSMFDELYPKGLQWFWKADFVNEIPDEAVEKHLEFAEKLPSMHSTMHLYPINGQASRVNSTDTAWNFRDATWAMVIVGVDPDPSNREKITKWAQDYFTALHPYSAGGAYVNFMMEEGEERIKATYGKNYDRLVQIKSDYDPHNLFCINQNIKPRRKAETEESIFAE